jgi:hypothetical protein
VLTVFTWNTTAHFRVELALLFFILFIDIFQFVVVRIKMSKWFLVLGFVGFGFEGFMGGVCAIMSMNAVVVLVFLAGGHLVGGFAGFEGLGCGNY